MPITVAETAISVTTIACECLFLVVCVLRRRARQPCWLAVLYVIYHLAFSACLRILHLRRLELGAAAYYVDVAFDFALVTGIVVELHSDSVRLFKTWRSAVKTNAALSLAAGTSFAGLLVMSLKFAGLTRSEVWENRIDLLTSFLLCTFLLIATWTNDQLYVRRSTKTVAIGRGLAVWASIALIVDLIDMEAMWPQSSVFDQVAGISWAFMVGYWAYAVWVPDQADNLPVRLLVDEPR